MNKISWKLSALVSTLLLGGTLTVYASDRERDSERFSFYPKYYEDEEEKKEDQEDEGDEKDEEDEKYEDEKDDYEEQDEDESNTDIVLPTTYTENAGRLLGSQCAQCHGTNGVSVNSWDSIAGEDNLEDEIYEDDEPIMSVQAHGYTSEEIILIGDWLKTLKNND